MLLKVQLYKDEFEVQSIRIAANLIVNLTVLNAV